MTRDVRRTAAIPSSIRSPAQPSTQSGTTLIACSLVMLGVALLTSAALRSLEDGISLTHNAVDRRLAQKAADDALHDAAMTLVKIPDQLTVAEAQGTHRIGELTGETYAYGGYLQPCAPPEYVLEVIPQSDMVNHAHAGSAPEDIYRVTARGKGQSDSTTVILQADFAVQLCKTDSDTLPNPSPEASQGAEQNTGEGTGQNAGQSTASGTSQTGGQSAGETAAKSTSQSAGEEALPKRAACVRGVRRLAWRMLQAT